MRTTSIVVAILLTAAISFGDDEPIDNDRATLGLRVKSIADMKEELKSKSIPLPPGNNGVVVVFVDKHGPGLAATLSPLDVVTHIGKEPITSVEQFKSVSESLKPNESTELLIYEIARAKTGVKPTWKKRKAPITPVTRRSFIIAHFNKTTDKFTESTFYRHVDSAQSPSEKSELVPYIVINKSGKVGLRLVLQYVSDDWLFIKRADLRIGDEVHVLGPFGPNDVKRDNTGGKVWEWADIPVEGNVADFVSAMKDANSCKLRCVGRTYVKDRDLSDGEILRIKYAAEAVKLLAEDKK